MSTPREPAISKDKFISLLKSATIVTEIDPYGVVPGNDPKLRYGYIFNTLSAPGLTVLYQNQYRYEAGNINSIELNSNIIDLWLIPKMDFVVVNKQKRKICPRQILDFIEEHTDIAKFDLSVIKEVTVTE